MKLLETVIFCGRQCIALRGHRDDKLDVQSNTCADHGNFLALLQFRIPAGDNVLKEHIELQQVMHCTLYKMS